jgi:hypothetical protein
MAQFQINSGENKLNFEDSEDIDTPEEDITSSTNSEDEKKPSKAWIWILFALLVIGVGISAYFLFF